MKLGYIIIYVESVPDTLSFYHSAFGLSIKFCLPSNEYGELDLGGDTTLAFAAESFVEQGLGSATFEKNRRESRLAAGAEISFVIDEQKGENVIDCFKRAQAAGAIVVQEPKSKPWGQVVGYVKDCNGFLVELCTPVKSE